MKNPLHYQLSEYDCGPTSMLNAISFLFEREEIPPEVIRNIMLYSLDCYGAEGAPGKSGTSCTAMMFLSHWLDGFGRVGQLPVSSRYLSGKDVYAGPESLINDALRRGGAAVVRLYFDEDHYVLMTGEENGCIRLFDPYYQTRPFPQQEDVVVTLEHPMQYNRIVPFSCFNRETPELYALGKPETREAVLLFNERTKLTADETIEYFI
ncbi:MAG: peptidase C39 [Oscillospiraceae bacterium]|nr:peptidase C39 [Oscillospiraceae bacterium]